MNINQLKNICEIIKNEICPTLNIEIEVKDTLDDKLEEFGGGFCLYELDKNKLKMKIGMYDKIHEFFKTKREFSTVERRYGVFLKGIGLELHDLTTFIIVFIHELGHAYYNDLFYSYEIDREVSLLSGVTVNAIELGFDNKLTKYCEEDVSLSPNHTFDFLEVLCDKYAIENFYPVWKLLKDKELV